MDTVNLDGVNAHYEMSNPDVSCYVLITHIHCMNEINGDTNMTVYYGKEDICKKIIAKVANECGLKINWVVKGRMILTHA